MAKVVVITAVMAVCLSYANGICPAREKDAIVVLPYQKITSEGISDATIKSATQNFLAKSKNSALTSENPAISCRKIAELRPSYEPGY